MGAVMEINIVSKDYVDVHTVIDKIKKIVKGNLESIDIEVMDSWGYDNLKKVYDVSKIRSLIMDEKVVNISLHITAFGNAGIQLEKSGDLYMTNVWGDISNYKELDVDYINNSNSIIYEELIRVLLADINQYNILVAAFGIETMFKYNEDITKMIEDSKNIIVWIINRKCNFRINNYKKYTVQNPLVSIFSRT